MGLKMRRPFARLATAAPLLSVFAAQVAALPSNSPVFGRQDNSSSLTGSSSNTYDYVIVGGGLTGLVVAHRLSEDRTKSVLVIEAGEFVDTDVTKIPQAATGLDFSLTWDGGFASQPEPGLKNGTFNVLVAKVLGGASVINGMVYDRGSAADYDAWEALGNRGWGWAGLEPYFIKGTTFTPPPKATSDEFNITWDTTTYGNGPLQVGISDFQYPDVKDYWAAWRATGVHLPVDGNNGEAYGASWFPNTLNVATGTRSHARAAYYDPISSRTNLNLLLGTVAEEIIFTNDRTPTARGVRVVSSANNKTTSVYARKEVILAAGSIQTPKLLQLSGVGPKSVLQAAGIKVKVELDAVGANFQDHPYTGVVYDVSNIGFPNPSSLSTNATFNASAWQQYVDTHTGPYTQARGNSLAFISLPEIASLSYKQIAKQLRNLSNSAYLPSIYKNNKRLLKGIKKQREVLYDLFQRKDAAIVEYPVPSTGSYALVALQKPLSRGTIAINPQNPQGVPLINWNTLTNPIDRTLFAASVRFLRTVWARPELDKFKQVELAPGVEYQTDDEIVDRLIDTQSINPTLAHPSGSCSMLPEDLGGCVSDKLLVYGTKRLSIIDASILPLIPSCHLQATMYGVAEKAADIIKSRA